MELVTFATGIGNKVYQQDVKVTLFIARYIDLL